jgi:hypothetical protein
MPTVFEWKEQETPETPLLLFDCRFPDGTLERWSTHAVELEGGKYEPRVLRHNVFEFRSYANEGIDAAARVSLTLADADSYISQLERVHGFKGSALTVRFAFVDLRGGNPVSESRVVFQGTGGGIEEITEESCRVGFTNRLSPQRTPLPDITMERRCPWLFPTTREEREAALTGGGKGRYGRYYRCGYSADIEGGVGDLNGGAAFTSCDGSRAACQQRGMFEQDSAGRPTARFGGCEFVPPSYAVRGYGERNFRPAAVLANEARYGEAVPLVYGTAWCSPPIVFARNDGNLTHLELLLGAGEIHRVLRVVANDIEILPGGAGANMTATGWYNLVSSGARQGAFNLDFVDAAGRPVGDPHGSVAVLSLVLPNRISDGRSLPKVQVLLEGLKLDQWDESGQYVGQSFSANPAWVILDLLRRCGWDTEEIDLPSFAKAAAFCDQEAAAPGGGVGVKRRRCNLAVERRRSAADLIRGVRNGAGFFLTYSSEGRLQLNVEGTLASQQPVKSPGSNAKEPLNGGWPAYEFGEGNGGPSGILLRENGASSLRIWSRSAADCPNRLTLEFQNELNEYRQDSLSMAAREDIALTGAEMTAAFPALGVPNAYQAAEVMGTALAKSVRGNLYIEFETGVQGFGLKPGDLITVTHSKEGWERQPFRITGIAPGLNYQTLTLTAQIHDDGWYAAAPALEEDDRGRGSINGRIPRPLVGVETGEDGETRFGVEERAADEADGGAKVLLKVSFSAPARPRPSAAGTPVVSLDADVIAGGGTLRAGETYYYAISAVDAEGNESGLSFLVRVQIPESAGSSAVRLKKLRFTAGSAGFRVYRGRDPVRLLRIAGGLSLAAEFLDTGLEAQAAGPPDPNYDHANFYWRLEAVPETQADSYGADSIGSAMLEMIEEEHRGRLVRITRGKGAGQERTVAHNGAHTLTVTPAWDVAPDATSWFTVAEASWILGASTQGGEAEFEVPNRSGCVIQVTGRSANALGEECQAALSPVTRWRIGGAAGKDQDAETAPEPTFGIGLAGKGCIEVGGIGFEDLTNTRSVTSATLTLWYWDELNSPTTLSLTEAMDEEADTVTVSSSGALRAGDLAQAGGELMAVVEEVAPARMRVVRGSHGSTVTAHAAGEAVYRLEKRVQILPFPRSFFGSPASGSYSTIIRIPNARIAAAELYVTNSQGNSPAAKRSYCQTAEEGLRTGSGGQLVWQAEGWLAVEEDVVPPVIVGERTAVRDMFATVQGAPVGGDVVVKVRVDGQEYCSLTVPEGALISNVVSGFGKAPLHEGAEASISIAAVPAGAGTSPGRDLTVTMRL